MNAREKISYKHQIWVRAGGGGCWIFFFFPFFFLVPWVLSLVRFLEQTVWIAYLSSFLFFVSVNWCCNMANSGSKATMCIAASLQMLQVYECFRRRGGRRDRKMSLFTCRLLSNNVSFYYFSSQIYTRFRDVLGVVLFSWKVGTAANDIFLCQRYEMFKGKQKSEVCRGNLMHRNYC